MDASMWERRNQWTRTGEAQPDADFQATHQASKRSDPGRFKLVLDNRARL